MLFFIRYRWVCIEPLWWKLQSNHTWPRIHVHLWARKNAGRRSSNVYRYHTLSDKFLNYGRTWHSWWKKYITEYDRQPFFHLTINNFFILDCENGFYGQDCSEKCLCKLDNTKSCGKVSGNCTCRAGWNGIDCSKDVDECTAFANICPDNSNCTNLNGTYLCTCEDGRFMSNNQCTGKLALLFSQFLITIDWIYTVNHKYMYVLVECKC